MKIEIEDIINYSLILMASMSVIFFAILLFSVMFGFIGKAVASFFLSMLFSGITIGVAFLKLEYEKEQKKAIKK